VTVDELLDRLADWDARSPVVISGISPAGDSVNERVFNLYTRGRPIRQAVIRRAQRTGQKSSGLPGDIGEVGISWQHSEHAEKLRELRCEISGNEQARTLALGWSTTSWPENRGPITVHELIGALVLLDPGPCSVSSASVPTATRCPRPTSTWARARAPARTSTRFTSPGSTARGRDAVRTPLRGMGEAARHLVLRCEGRGDRSGTCQNELGMPTTD
jgi:hypothetical protein